MQEVKHARLALALALAAASPSVTAVVLGEIETRSALGEPLDARIPFTIPQGRSVDASCFALVREADEAASALGEGVLTLERRRGATALRLRTLAPVMEPAISVRVRAACSGADPSTRVYAVLLDPRAGSAPAAVSAPTVASAPGILARIDAREGDTLEAMATKMHPLNAAARERYVAALRAANPALGAQDAAAPIAPGTSVAMPDPRAVARARREPRSAVAEAPRERPAARARRSSPPPVAAARERPAAPPPVLPEAPSTAPPVAQAPESAPAVKPAPPAKTARRPAVPARGPEPAFVLKLSSGEVDLTRSRQIDDRMRAQLRERLLVLDADDQVAAMLSMRNSLRQLEARVAEMQLKLDSMPASLAGRGLAVAPPPAKIDPPKVDPPRVDPPKIDPPKVEAPKVVAPPPQVVPPKVEPPKVEPPKVEAPKAEPPKVEARVDPPKAEAPKVEAPKVEAPPPKAEPPRAPAVPVESRPGTRPVSQPPPAEDGLPQWLWGVAALLALLAALLGWRIWRKRSERRAGEWADAQPEAVAAPATVDVAPPVSVADEPIEVAAPMRPEMGSDAVLATRLTENSSELRRRYLEERFPEVQNGTIAVEDPVSVVKGARLFYEDGALPRAVELLQFAIEDNTQEVRPWLALFEIFRLERLTGQFAELAQRFREHHGKGPYWPKVQFFGREIDPGNPLYREEAALNTLETIGPREAKRLAAGLATVGASATFDPIAENWLNAPMDFENEVLANELRRKLMSDAALTEQDLVPNPMPALRSVEMFTVA